MKIVLATDAWAPQVNGVVRTYQNVCKYLESIGNDVEVIHPNLFRTVPLPTYPDIRLAVFPANKVAKLIENSHADALHIATEGPIGFAARNYCLKHKLPFTTSFHTRFPEYIRLRAPVPLALSYSVVRRFHGSAVRTLSPTDSQTRALKERGFKNVVTWCRGVDSTIFKPWQKNLFDLPRPIFAYMGRVAVEKNIEAFLKLDLPGSKVVIGDGPDLEKLQKRYDKVHFTGMKHGKELAENVSSADVFVFPSLTDTYGVVMLEAMACGLPVAAFPVQGPVDVVKNGITGVLDEDLGKAAIAASKLNPQDCIDFASTRTWRETAQTFVRHLQPLHNERIYSGQRFSVEC